MKQWIIENCKKLLVSVVSFTISLFIIMVAFNYREISEDKNNILIENKGMFMTHCIKIHKQPWYICEDVWYHFSDDIKLNFKTEAAKYMSRSKKCIKNFIMNKLRCGKFTMLTDSCFMSMVVRKQLMLN